MAFAFQKIKDDAYTSKTGKTGLKKFQNGGDRESIRERSVVKAR